MTDEALWHHVAERLSVIIAAERKQETTSTGRPFPTTAQFDQYAAEVRDVLDMMGVAITDPDALRGLVAGLLMAEIMLCRGEELGDVPPAAVVSIEGAVNGLLHTLYRGGFLPMLVEP